MIEGTKKWSVVNTRNPKQKIKKETKTKTRQFQVSPVQVQDPEGSSPLRT